MRILPGLDAEIAAGPACRPLARPHRRRDRQTANDWLLHCGDAYFNHGEVETPPNCPPVLRFFQNLTAADNRARRSNLERLRELAVPHGDEVTLLCSHDPHELEREQARASTATATSE